MAIQISADPALQTADYILSRLTSYFGNKPDYFNAFIDGKLPGQGWLPSEAFFALTSPVARRTTKVTMVRGKAQGSSKFDPDLEIDINREFHQLAVVPVFVSADNPLTDQVGNGLRETFEWLSGAMKARAMVYLLAFPSSLDDDGWKTALTNAEEQYHAKIVGQMEFVIPRPPRQMARAAAAVFMHASRIPGGD